MGERQIAEKIMAAKRRTDPVTRPFRGHFSIWCQDAGEAKAIMSTIADAVVEEGIQISFGLD